MSEFGGLANLMLGLLFVLPYPLSHNILMGDIIEELFYIREERHRYKLNFTWLDRILNLRFVQIVITLFTCGRSKPSTLFRQLNDRVNDELSIINILKRLQKLTALTLSMSKHSAEKQDEILKDARNLYNGYAGVADGGRPPADAKEFDETGQADIFILLDERVGTGTLQPNKNRYVLQ